jgi:outer membrane protein TolC/ABC-type uncharacterized transport system substrate-binding protein
MIKIWEDSMQMDLKKIILPLFILIILTNITLLISQNLPSVTIGIVKDGPWERYPEVLTAFKREVLELTRGEFDVRFPESKTLEANWTVTSVRQALNRLLADSEVDIIIAGGVIASQEACRTKELPVPVIAPVVLDPKLQGLPLKAGKSGRKNLCYTHSPARLSREVQYFSEIIPFKKLTLLSSLHFSQAIPQFEDRLADFAKDLGIEIYTIYVTTSADETLSQIPTDAEAVFVGTLFQMPNNEFITLAKGLIDKNLPSFALWGKPDVERGILAGLLPDSYLDRLARRTALNIQRILLGQDPGDIPVAFAPKERLTVNMTTARAINVYPTWAVLTEAELIDPIREEDERILTLENAVLEALDANLDLAASQRIIAAGAQEVNIARSNLLPHIDLSALGLVIDKDRAEASFGTQAERTISGSITASQLIYSEPAWANLKIQKSLQEIIVNENDELRLDIIEEATTAYLNILRAKTFEKIQRDNLRLSRENLELAEVRTNIGFSGIAEVYRWESEISTNRKNVIIANAQRNLTEINMNRILNRPLEEGFATAETEITDEAVVLRVGEVLKYMQNPRDFKILRNFMVNEGLSNSPEIKRIDAAVAAQRRLLSSTNNAFWAPTVVLQGEVTNRFLRKGAGSNGGIDFSGIPNFSFEFPQADDTDWNIGLNLSYSLFDGASKFAERSQALEELMQFQLERKDVMNRIEQRVRSAFHTAGASFAAIQQTRNAAESAMKNLDLVLESYSQGAVSIVDLLDAQNSAFITDLGASNAIYDFLIDFTRVERAIGKFDVLRTAEERREFYNRVKSFFDQNDVD